MNSLPVSCHNCYSEKREFYVYLECRHFICLSCCLFMANLQTLTVRCCHRNTKMSEQLIETIDEEIQQRKKLMKQKGQMLPQSIYSDKKDRKDKISLFQMKREQLLQKKSSFSQKKREEQMRREQKQQHFHRTRDQDFVQSHVSNVETSFLNSLKHRKQDKDKIREQEKRNKQQKQKQKDRVEQKKRQINKKVQEKKNNRQLQFLQKQQRTQKKSMSSYMNSIGCMNTAPQVQFDSPSFKEIQMRTQPKSKQPLLQFNQQSSKQNYQYWKNYDTTKDRILAKLNHHQTKMNSLIKQHYH